MDEKVNLIAVLISDFESRAGLPPHRRLAKAPIDRVAVRWLEDQGVTAVITGERAGALTRQGLEEFVSDAVIFTRGEQIIAAPTLIKKLPLVDALVVRGNEGNQVFTLHSPEEPYRALIEEMHEGAVVLSSRGDVLYCNARFAALIGEPLEAVVGNRIERFFRASERDKFERLLRFGSGRWRSSFISSGRGAFDVSLSLTTASSTGGRRLNLIVTDLSELLEAHNNRARAEHDSRTKTEFLTMLAHELRTPLGTISNAVAVLELTHATGQSAAHAHDVIARQVGLVSRLIDDLLDVERVVSGRIRIQRTRLDIGQTTRDAVAVFTSDTKLDRQIEVSTETVWVDGDAERLQQLLTNIVGNAVKYTPPGGRIRVDVRAERGDAVISVADNGFGISAELLPYVFDLYVQADRTTAHARGGLGIGLALVRRLVELHGGIVEAASDGEGHGSTFVVRLKQVAPPATSARHSESPSSAPDTTSMTLPTAASR